MYSILNPAILKTKIKLNARSSSISSININNTLSSSSPRPAIILPGLGNNTGDYKALVATLTEGYGVPCVVAEVSRLDWLRNASGLLDANYWRGTLQPSPVLDWYLKRVEQAISQVKLLCSEEGRSSNVSLIGHSAGGWLARVYMQKYGISDISLLLTLGSPHLPPLKEVKGVVDQTRGLLTYVNTICAPAVYTPEMKYVCIAGRYLNGASKMGDSSTAHKENNSTDETIEMVESSLSNTDEKNLVKSSAFQSWFITQSYKQVCGRGDVWGDGVVPEIAAHLEGALNISLDGVYHSPVGSNDHNRPWYGSPSVVQKWAHHLLE